MGFSRRIGAGILPPAMLLLGALTLLAWLLPRPGLYAVKLIVAVGAAGLAAMVWRRTQRTNHAIARFIDAIAHGDLTQGFRMDDGGSGFDTLGRAFDGALARLRAERHAAAAENRFAGAIVDAAPAPLLTVAADGTVGLANKAARHLFREADGRPVEAFARYGGGFARLLATLPPGGREVCHVLWSGLPQRALVTAATVDRQGRPHRILSVSIIQGELERAELSTQADLVRVLTHEIMNSLTPVTSLAQSASRLLAEVDAGDAAAMADARAAIDTLARRATGIAGFVESYRDFGRTPSITVARFGARAWIEELAASFRAMPQATGVTLDVAIEPDTLRLDADAELLGQVALNLLKNAGEAAAGGTAPPAVSLAVSATGEGRVRLTVADTGPGVPAALAHEIFLPFFTTKASGTGVGLSFARQVVLLHGGTIGVRARAGGGAEFVIVI